jgi:membrane-bound ClpP family serine protease
MPSAIFAKSLFASLVVLLSLAATGEGRADERLRSEFYGSLVGPGGSGSISDGPTALLVTGVIGPGSYDEFRSALDHGAPELVVIDGPGGVLGEALMIGQEVRRRHLNTLVGAHHSCASACAVVFLSGRSKYVGAGAVIGLHSASYADGRSDPEATQVMADYLRGVGVPSATLRRMARTLPSDIRWLSKAEQRAMNIQAFKGSQ